MVSGEREGKEDVGTEGETDTGRGGVVTVWKVVHIDPTGDMFSAFSMLPCVYRKGLVTSRPKGGGPLCAFSDLYSAERFSNYAFYIEIWVAEAVLSKETMIWYPDNNSPPPNMCVYMEFLPRGTVLCESIKLTSKVW